MLRLVHEIPQPEKEHAHIRPRDAFARVGLEPHFRFELRGRSLGCGVESEGTVGGDQDLDVGVVEEDFGEGAIEGGFDGGFGNGDAEGGDDDVEARFAELEDDGEVGGEGGGGDVGVR